MVPAFDACFLFECSEKLEEEKMIRGNTCEEINDDIPKISNDRLIDKIRKSFGTR
jgi:hypothetical protein